jgi:tetratricopeptide (TPR) repeat protein
MPANDQTSQNPRRSRIWIAVVLVAVGAAAAFAWLQQSHESRTAEYLTKCRQAAALEDWQALDQLASTWRQWDPQSVDAVIFLAECRNRQGKLREAADLLLALPDDSEKTPAGLLIALDILFQELNQPKEALDVAERLKRIAPEITGVRQRLIFFYALTLQRGKMLGEIRTSIAERAEPPDAYVYLVLANHLTFTNGPQLNATWARSAPDDLDYRAAWLVQTADNLSTADSPTDETARKLEQIRSEIETLSEEHPDNEPLLISRLFKAAQEDATDEVGELLNTVTEIGWNNSIFWRYRGWFLHRTGDLEAAEEAYLKAREVFPMDWQTWQGLAEVQRALGKLDEATAAQETALEGKELRKHLLQMPNVNDVDPDTLHRIGAYADHCGDDAVFQAASQRLQDMNYVPQETPQASPTETDR